MNNPQNNMKKKWIWLVVIPVLFIIFIPAVLVLSSHIFDRKNQTNSWKMQKYYHESEVPNLASKNANNALYWDQETQISFISYEKNNGKKWLEKEELALFAAEFKKVATYGPEIGLLNAIIIDDYDVIDANTAYGLYVTTAREIHINTDRFNKYTLSTKEKINLIMPTLFHEYMHHWANTYVNNGMLKKDDPNSQDNIVYENSDVKMPQIWDGKYVDGFVRLLNYDKEFHPPRTYLNEANHATKFFNLKNIFDYSNYENKLYYGYYTSKNKLFLPEVSDDQIVTFDDKPDLFIQNKPLYYLHKLKYYYSMTELVPREWMKVAYQLPYDNITKRNDIINDRTIYNDNIDFKPMPNTNNVWYKTGIYGLIVQHRPDKKNKKFSGSSFGVRDGMTKYAHPGHDPQPLNYEFDEIGYASYMNSFIDDWTRTTSISTNYLNGNISFDNVPFYPNNLFAGIYYTADDVNAITSTSKDFLALQLEAMSYGKMVSQIFNRLDYYEWTSTKKGDSISYSTGFFNEFKLMGYLPNKGIKHIVYYDDKNNEVRIPLRIMKNNFRAKKALILTKEQRDAFWLPSDIDETTYIPYLSDQYINAQNVYSPLFFWNDLNSDNIIQEGEKINKFSIPEYKYLSTFNSSMFESWSAATDEIQQAKILASAFVLYKDEKERVWVIKYGK
ncbi:Uncharacterised protein [Mycoplasmopsis californica]|uniref:DUF31 domain-containing protein n=1 Tax=Mycoplasmopsis equigenitalium TaxID=114883 RepID=A0ABY5J0J6_9BACT|nr:hypothetical protein [Mycoplasmopsis equigenitalium]UUD36779.1 hypothetical protein NPA09_02680 [Mycoplasmopsis equigenitalium]VEU69922.1 Uncharacterised protein [Mycoplasmopsis californica]